MKQGKCNLKNEFQPRRFMVIFAKQRYIGSAIDLNDRAYTNFYKKALSKKLTSQIAKKLRNFNAGKI